MPLNWRALYPQIHHMAEAEVARLWHAAEQKSVVAEALIGGQTEDSGAKTPAALSPGDPQAALAWLGAAIRAWNAVLRYIPEGSPEHQSGSHRRQRLQQALLALLRQAGSDSGQ